MPRVARAVFSGVAHHITQRGNRREDVFYTGLSESLKSNSPEIQ